MFLCNQNTFFKIHIYIKSISIFLFCQTYIQKHWKWIRLKVKVKFRYLDIGIFFWLFCRCLRLVLSFLVLSLFSILHSCLVMVDACRVMVSSWSCLVLSWSGLVSSCDCLAMVLRWSRLVICLVCVLPRHVLSCLVLFCLVLSWSCLVKVVPPVLCLVPVLLFVLLSFLDIVFPEIIGQYYYCLWQRWLWFAPCPDFSQLAFVIAYVLRWWIWSWCWSWCWRSWCWCWFWCWFWSDLSLVRPHPVCKTEEIETKYQKLVSRKREGVLDWGVLVGLCLSVSLSLCLCLCLSVSL